MILKILFVAAVVTVVSAIKVQNNRLEHYSHGHTSIIPIHILGENQKHEERFTQPTESYYKNQEASSQEGQHGHHSHQDFDYYAEPKYEYEYRVKDPHTHDIKQQHESRIGDIVKGEYSLHEPDGTIRVVKYHADKKSGFHADVTFSGHTIHIVPQRQRHQ